MVTGLGVTSHEHRLALGRKYRGDHGVGDIAHKRELGPSRTDRSAQGLEILSLNMNCHRPDTHL